MYSPSWGSKGGQSGQIWADFMPTTFSGCEPDLGNILWPTVWLTGWPEGGLKAVPLCLGIASVTRMLCLSGIQLRTFSKLITLPDQLHSIVKAFTFTLLHRIVEVG